MSSDLTEGAIDPAHEFEELQSENIIAAVDPPSFDEEDNEIEDFLEVESVSFALFSHREIVTTWTPSSYT